MRGVGAHAQTLETAFDHAVEQCCVPLDRLRLRFIRALGPLGLELVRNQELRVAVTGAASSVFRHAGLEAALNQSFTPQSAASVKIDASDLNADIHASAAYRANLISVQTQRAVQQMLE